MRTFTNILFLDRWAQGEREKKVSSEKTKGLAFDEGYRLGKKDLDVFMIYKANESGQTCKTEQHAQIFVVSKDVVSELIRVSRT